MMRVSIRPNIALLILGFAANIVGCGLESTPENNFEVFWQDFDQRYGQFGVKDIDWDEVYDTYSPQVGPATTDDELFDVFVEMLDLLNDNHAGIAGNGRAFDSGYLGSHEMEDFELDLVTENYLQDISHGGEGNFTYGFVTDEIGYLHISQMWSEANDLWYEDIDRVLEVIGDANGIIVDVRGNGGGDDVAAFNIADRFADARRPALETRYRDGPGHDNFGETKTWHVEPRGPRQFLRPVVLLTNRFSNSAAENFTLAMKTIPHVTQMGTITAGAFANVVYRELLNGWLYKLPMGLFTTPEGRCYEGIGIAPAPDDEVINTPEDLGEGRDVVLEAAIERLSGG